MKALAASIPLLAVALVSCASVSTVPRSNPFIAAHNARIASLVSSWDAEGGSVATRPVGFPKRSLADAASAAWWGFDPEDATDELQAAVDSGSAVLLVPNLGKPWYLSRTLRLRGGQELILESGVEIVAKEGAFLAMSEPLISAVGISGFSISGYGAALRMRKDDYGKPPYERSEWRHALALRGVSRAMVSGLRIASSGGDGIYVGTTGPRDARIPCEDLVLRDLEIVGNNRQGISVISARRLLVEDCLITGTAGALPMAGIDFEPNSGDPGFYGCLIRRCRIEGNAGAGVQIALGLLGADEEPESIRIEDCYIASRPLALWVLGLGEGSRGSAVFARCTFRGLRLARGSQDFSVIFE